MSARRTRLRWRLPDAWAMALFTVACLSVFVLIIEGIS